VHNFNRYHGNTSGLNYPHSLNITLLYKLPLLDHSNLFLKTVLGGWSFNDITTLRSGSSLDPGLTASFQGLASRPDVVPGTSTNGPKTWKNGSTQQWFNLLAFECPGSSTPGPCGTMTTPNFGHYGDAMTGIIRGPGQDIFNMALFKDFNVMERAHIEFRAEAFNAFNHTNPNNPNTTLGNSNYGKVTSAADPRIIELAAKLKF